MIHIYSIHLHNYIHLLTTLIQLYTSETENSIKKSTADVRLQKAQTKTESIDLLHTKKNKNVLLSILGGIQLQDQLNHQWTGISPKYKHCQKITGHWSITPL